MALKQQQIKKLIAVLLKHRPDLVIVKTTNRKEKRTLVDILQGAGAQVIHRGEK